MNNKARILDNMSESNLQRLISKMIHPDYRWTDATKALAEYVREAVNL